jgi:hypothetical protein
MSALPTAIGATQHSSGNADRHRRPESDIAVATGCHQGARFVRQSLGPGRVAGPGLNTAANQQRDGHERVVVRRPSLALQLVRKLQRAVDAPGVDQRLPVQRLDEPARVDRRGTCLRNQRVEFRQRAGKARRLTSISRPRRSNSYRSPPRKAT